MQPLLTNTGKENFRELSDLINDHSKSETPFWKWLNLHHFSKLNIGDVMEDIIYIRAEKNESPRSLGIPNFVYRIVREYVDTYRMSTDQKALFTGKRGRNTSDYLRAKIKKIGRSAGVHMLHSHAFRHRVATTLLKREWTYHRFSINLGTFHP